MQRKECGEKCADRFCGPIFVHPCNGEGDKKVGGNQPLKDELMLFICGFLFLLHQVCYKNYTYKIIETMIEQSAVLLNPSTFRVGY